MEKITSVNDYIVCNSDTDLVIAMTYSEALEAADELSVVRGEDLYVVIEGRVVYTASPQKTLFG